MTDADDDVAAVGRCLRGDSSAFEPLVARYQRVLFSVALRMVGDYEDAKDVTQTSFIRAFEGLEGYDPNRKFFSWIYRIVVNECLNLRRARRPQAPFPPDLAVKGGAFEAVDAGERRERVQAALLRLSHEHREVVVLRHFAELSYGEISEAVGVPEKTVKSRLFDARRHLELFLRGEERPL